MAQFDRITFDPQVMGGKPCLRGMRVTVGTIVGLIASPERIIQIRQNRLLSLNASDDTPYVDRQAVSSEVAFSRKLFMQNNWPVIDVTRRSIEETAAAIINLYKERQAQLVAQ